MLLATALDGPLPSQVDGIDYVIIVVFSLTNLIWVGHRDSFFFNR